MPNNVISKNLRIVPRDTTVLDIKVGSSGEIFYDRTSNTLRLYDGVEQGGYSLAKDDFSNVTNSSFLAKATAAGVGGNTSVTVSGTQPSGPSTGNLWYNSTSDALYVYDGSAWQLSSPSVNLDGYATESFVTSEINAIPPTDLTGYATENYVNSAISAIPSVDLTGYATETYVGQQISNLVIPAAYAFNVAGDDSTTRRINNGETVKFIGSGGITTSSDTEGNITISSSGVGNISFSGNNIDSNDSSPISFIPAVTFQGDIIGENDVTGLQLTATEQLTVTGPGTISGALDAGSIITTSIEASSITSTSNFNISADLVNIQSLGLVSENVVNLGVTNGGVIAHETDLGSIFYHSLPTANFTANFTNLVTPGTYGFYSISLAVIITQGATARMPIAAQIEGVGQTIKWLGAGGTPSGNSNQTNIVTFTLIKTGLTWTVLASSANYG